MATHLLSVSCPGCGAPDLLRLDDRHTPYAPILPCLSCGETWCGYCITSWECLTLPLRHHNLAHHILRCPNIPRGDDKWQRTLTAFIDRRLGQWDLEGSPDVNAALIRRSAAAIKDATIQRFVSAPPIVFPAGFMDSLTVRCPLDAGGGVCGHALGS